ncbi:MAG TPA: endonuclease III [Syntrophobacteraceae bacterium]|mgnify:CR=1 FL=1|nr:endonuclease III [Syntrophobacteraceae bacterium]
MVPHNPSSRPPAGESLQGKAAAVLPLLDRMYPQARCSLNFENPLELLVATILSAQCTDERVNQVTPGLFRKYPTAGAYAQVPIEELEADIKSTGFYRNKAKSIRSCCAILAERFEGAVPRDLDLLVQLPGIGRKTANVILGNAYGIPGIVVDTHVSRVAQRLGLTLQKDADKIERDLMALVPRERWTLFSHQMIQHGRNLCRARKPRTEACPLRPHCDFGSGRST